MAVGKASIQRAIKARGPAEAGSERRSVTEPTVRVSKEREAQSAAASLRCLQLPLSQIISEKVRLSGAFLTSVSAYGIIEPVLVYQTDEGYRILCGSRRVAAAMQLGLETVPAVVVEADAARAHRLRRELTAFEHGQAVCRGGNGAAYAIGENQMPEFLL